MDDKAREAVFTWLTPHVGPATAARIIHDFRHDVLLEWLRGLYVGVQRHQPVSDRKAVLLRGLMEMYVSLERQRDTLKTRYGLDWKGRLPEGVEKRYFALDPKRLEAFHGGPDPRTVTRAAHRQVDDQGGGDAQRGECPSPWSGIDPG